jgi:hypothetical protein
MNLMMAGVPASSRFIGAAAGAAEVRERERARVRRVVMVNCILMFGW